MMVGVLVDGREMIACPSCGRAVVERHAPAGAYCGCYQCGRLYQVTAWGLSRAFAGLAPVEVRELFEAFLDVYWRRRIDEVNAGPLTLDVGAAASPAAA